MRYLTPILATCALLTTAAPAGAVINGEPIEAADVPTFSSYGCGGTLVTHQTAW